MARILLIESGVERPENFVYQVYPPHGLMYLSSYLRKVQPGHEIKILDLMIERNRAENHADMIREFNPDILGIHAMNFQSSSLHRTAAFLKSLFPNVPVFAGGPYPTAEPEKVIGDINIDAAALGEGENTFADMVAATISGNGISGIPGTVTKKNGEVMRGPQRDYISDLDSIPFPAWDLIEIPRYFADKVLNQNDFSWHREVTTIFTSRACPFQCIYCHNMFGKKFRARKPEKVLEEIRTLCDNYGIRELHIIDDCFNCDIERAKEILRLIIKSDMEIKLAFPNGIRGDRIDDEMLELLKAAGTYKVNFGIESGSREMQKIMRKNLNLDKIEKIISKVDRAGIFIHGFFILGFPGETEDQIRQTIAFACRSRLHTAGFALLHPFPGTEIRRIADERGLPTNYDFEDTSYAQLGGNLSAVSDKKLVKLHRLAHWKFYFSPRRLIRIFKDMPNKTRFIKIAWAHFWLKFV